MAAYVFLGLTGKDFEADEPDVVRTMERLADRRVSESQLASWFRAGIRSLR